MHCPHCGMRHADFFKADTQLSEEEQHDIFAQGLPHPDRLSERERKKLFESTEEQTCPECRVALREESESWTREEDWIDERDPRSPFYVGDPQDEIPPYYY